MTVISVEHLSKTYRLGQIGTGTFTNACTEPCRSDLKLWWAKARGKPNPLLKIGESDHGNRDGEDLWALKDVSFTVEQGEVLGIPSIRLRHSGQASGAAGRVSFRICRCINFY
ncbi:MAG: hypothetical protein AB1846_12030 [Chloroflexota bacterium]